MDERIFIIGIGGTGMRCLESFVHLCAMGMFDGTTVEMLALDTDRENGNFRRLYDLVDTYSKCKGVNKEQHALKDTFFSAKINYYQFSHDYARQDTGNFSRITKYGDLQYKSKDQAALADLLLTKNTREFDLKHGYRAQTNLGSFLMHHNILEEVRTNHDGHLAKFISSLVTAGQSKVFVMGSVFGGTGASSIPIIPKAFTEAARILMPGSSLKETFFGAILLTSYFSFKVPSSDYVTRQLVVATADKFALNSQAAMMFYNEDKTVKQTYQKFYMLGTPGIDFQTSHGESETLTGGAHQQNDSHFIELFAAFAAYDFFRSSNDELKRTKGDPQGVKYFYRTIREDGVLEFADFVSPDEVEKLAKRFGMLVAMSFLVNVAWFYASAQNGDLKKNNISGYEDIDPREVEAMHKYFNYFHFRLNEEAVENGWLRQLYNSAGGGDKFVFRSDVFSSTSGREMKKFTYNSKLFKSDFEKHAYNTGFFSDSSTKAFDTFKDSFIKTQDDPNISNKCEKLTRRMYATLCDLYSFS
ncbi:MAG: hypothetical protein R3C61_08955 [Bacteroidia bacterium]